MNESEVKIIGEISNNELNSDWKNSREEINLDEIDFEVEFGPGTKGEHEAIDRLGIVINQIDELLLYHPTICNDEQLFRLIRISQKFLEKSYSYMEEEIPSGQIVKMVRSA